MPEALGELTQLQWLDFAGNQLIALPEVLGKLTQLQQLDLSRNNLASLPGELRKLSCLEGLYLHENSGLAIPQEILGSTFPDVIRKENSADPKAILDYQFRTRKSRRPLNEAKLVLVGFGGVGKTSLVNRLIHDRFDPKEKMTDGIAIADWLVPLKDAEVRVHVWNFGGQEIMHATHQFFLTHRSLYIVVLNGRQGREDTDAEYWLNLIASFGGNSPVIVVLNKIKEHPFAVNQPALRQKFPMVRDVFATDCADPPEGRPTLLDVIQREIDALPGRRDAFPAAWFAIKDRLSSMPDNFLTFDHFRGLCAEAGVRAIDEQNQLAEILHRLGVALNYRDDTRLHDLNVLNPRWVTEGVYKILNHPTCRRTTGELSIRDVARDPRSGELSQERHPSCWS